MPHITQLITHAVSFLSTLLGFALALSAPLISLVHFEQVSWRLFVQGQLPLKTGQESLVAIILGCVLYYLTTYFLKLRQGRHYAFANVLASVVLIVYVALSDARAFGPELSNVSIGLFASLWLAILATQLTRLGAESDGSSMTSPADEGASFFSPLMDRIIASYRHAGLFALRVLGGALALLSIPASVYFLARIVTVFPGA